MTGETGKGAVRTIRTDAGPDAPGGPAAAGGAGRGWSTPRPRTARDDLRLIALAGAGFYLALAGAAVMASGLLPGGRAGHLAAGGITLAAAAPLLVMAVLAAADAAPVPPARGPGGA